MHEARGAFVEGQVDSANSGEPQGAHALGLQVSPAFVRQGGRFGDAGDGVATKVPVQWPVLPRQSPSAPHTGRRPR